MFSLQSRFAFLFLVTTAFSIHHKDGLVSVEIDSKASVTSSQPKPNARSDLHPTVPLRKKLVHASTEDSVKQQQKSTVRNVDVVKPQYKSTVHADTLRKKLVHASTDDSVKQQQKSTVRNVDLVKPQYKSTVHADTGSIVRQQKSSTTWSLFGSDLPNREPTTYGRSNKKWLHSILGFQAFLLLLKLGFLCEVFSSFGTIGVVCAGYYAATQGDMYITTILIYQIACALAFVKDVISFCLKLFCLSFSPCFILIHLLLWVAHLAGFFFAHHIWLEWARTRNVPIGPHGEKVPDYFGEYHDSAVSKQVAMAVGFAAIAALSAKFLGGGHAATGAATSDGAASAPAADAKVEAAPQAAQVEAAPGAGEPSGSPS